jgi:signal transduction histidine kinase
MQSKPIIRRLIFFLMAVLLPSAVLLSFGVVLLKQENELNERRLEELRTFAARDLSDSLFQVLESAYGRIDQPQERYSDSSPPLLVLGRSVDGRITFARDDILAGSTNTVLDADFQQFLRETAREELSGAQLGNVISKYEQRLSRTSSPEQIAFLELRIARVLEKVSLPEASLDWDLRLLAHPSSVVDEYGLPFAYYAADRLIRSELNNGPVLSRLQEDLHSPDWLSSDAVLFLTDLLTSFSPLGRADSVALSETSEEHTVAALLEERTVLLQQNGTHGPSWFVLPDSPWLVRRINTQGEEWIAAVHLSELQPLPGGSFHRGPVGSDTERALSSRLAGLVATINTTSLSANDGQQGLLIAGLILVLGLTLFGGYLLWRDVRRETRLAALRMQFVSSVSHELRTPLTSIRLFAETMLSYGGKKEERDRNLAIIANESDRLTRMLNNVLNTSRIEQGTMSYRPEFAEVSEVVYRAADAMEYSFVQAGLELKVDTETIWTHFDPDAIEQALINLLSNSIKYASTGKLVSLSCARNGTHLKLTVADEGPGISDEEQERIFERFYRGARVEDRRVTGVGLGLALVDHIATGHQGRVSVESSPGEGAMFTILLPIEDS